jgi:threonine dehydrogenase-like Zn-dependent dehydrogenase
MRGAVDGWDFKAYILGMLFYRYISENITNYINKGKIDTTPLITHRFPLTRIAEAYELFEQKRDGVIKVAITQ